MHASSAYLWLGKLYEGFKLFHDFCSNHSGKQTIPKWNSLGKTKNTRASVYDRYLLYCDVIVCLNPSAGVKYFDPSRSKMPVWVLSKKAREACSHQVSSVGHCSSSSISRTWFVFGQCLQVKRAAVCWAFSVWPVEALVYGFQTEAADSSLGARETKSLYCFRRNIHADSSPNCLK